jgi:hypothetical protein
MARAEIHAAVAQQPAAEHPVAETVATPAADIRAVAPAEIAEAIPAGAEVLAEVEAVDIPVEEAARPAAVVEAEDILVVAAEGTATKAQSTRTRERS